MDTLRIILIVLGIALVAGIWLADRLKRRVPKRERRWSASDLDAIADDTSGAFTAREEPLAEGWVDRSVSLSARRNEPLPEEHLEGLKGLGREPDDGSSATGQPAEQPTVSPGEAVVVLTVMAGEGKLFTGPWLLKVLQEIGLEHGEMGIFHYFLAGKQEPLFSVANILEPGRFELAEIVTLETPGVALFMRLPTVVAGELALQTLLQKSRQMAAQLSGTLCDEQRRPLGEEKLAELEQLARRYTAS
jgi:cell division protein ZipA